MSISPLGAKLCPATSGLRRDVREPVGTAKHKSLNMDSPTELQDDTGSKVPSPSASQTNLGVSLTPLEPLLDIPVDSLIPNSPSESNGQKETASNDFVATFDPLLPSSDSNMSSDALFSPANTADVTMDTFASFSTASLNIPATQDDANTASEPSEFASFATSEPPLAASSTSNPAFDGFGSQAEISQSDSVLPFNDTGISDQVNSDPPAPTNPMDTIEGEGANVHAPDQSINPPDDDDDFGDFEDFVQPVQYAAPVAPIATQHQEAGAIPPDTNPIADQSFSTFTSFEQPKSVCDKNELARIRNILKGCVASSPELEEAIEILKYAFPLTPAEDVPISQEVIPIIPFFEEMDQPIPADGKPPESPQALAPNSVFQEQSWYKLWHSLTTDSVFTEAVNLKFRWRRSETRKAFHASLGITLISEEGPRPVAPNSTGRESLDSPRTSKQPPSSAEPKMFKSTPDSKSTKDSREAELAEARRLCDIPEDDIRGKSTAELQELILTLTSYHQKMQDQANYWLDSKEQLVMDAEMHNKMIASLVQYAQQQQVTPKGGQRSSSPGKKGKSTTVKKR
ncbi:hypothetical protein DFS34DRAFT_678305 [Phlyctochytrium arcticum]|nr:hypothetical protein DFS34DRAFT_678305 [Phlyctochytrium arcticum]